MKNKKQKEGAAILIYLLIMAIVVTVLMVGTYSRLLLALKRGQSTTDALSVNYTAEGEINDWIARLSEGFIKTNPFSVHETKTIGTTTLTITGSQTGNTQTIVIEADRPYASTKITADRTLENLGNGQSVDIMLGLDCTGSMNTIDFGDTKTRIANLKDAALNFISNIPSNGKFRVGVYVFGIDAQWLKTPIGQDISLANNVPLSQITTAIQNGFVVPGSGTDWQRSSACQTILNSTSVGTAFVFSQDYLKTQKQTGNKQVEIVITDGEPNSRIPYAACTPNVYCPSNASLCNKGGYGQCSNSGNACTQMGIDFLRCSVADTNSVLPNSFDKGVRDPNIDAYAVTISTAPNGDASSLLSQYLGTNYIPASRAGQLSGILSNILTTILSKRETITVHKDVPGS